MHSGRHHTHTVPNMQKPQGGGVATPGLPRGAHTVTAVDHHTKCSYPAHGSVCECPLLSARGTSPPAVEQASEHSPLLAPCNAEAAEHYKLCFVIMYIIILVGGASVAASGLRARNPEVLRALSAWLSFPTLTAGPVAIGLNATPGQARSFVSDPRAWVLTGSEAAAAAAQTSQAAATTSPPPTSPSTGRRQLAATVQGALLGSTACLHATQLAEQGNPEDPQSRPQRRPITAGSTARRLLRTTPQQIRSGIIAGGRRKQHKGSSVSFASLMSLWPSAAIAP